MADTAATAGDTAAPAGDTAAPAGRRLVRVLVSATFLQWLGAGAVLPLLPLFLHHHGGSDVVVGAAMAAFFAAQLVVQYPLGRVADRIGCLPVLLGGLAVYAAGTLAFVLPASPMADVAFRALQGAGAAGVSVAALALISANVPLTSRGQAVGSVYGAQVAGLAVGPLVGSLVGVPHMNVLFIGSAAASLAACVPVLMVGTAQAPSPEARHDARPGEVPRRRLIGDRGLVGAVVAACALGLVMGAYESCWTLLLHHRGAQDWQIGLSWTLFAVPFAALARPGGWLADHLDRRILVAGSLLSCIAFCCTYPFVPLVPVLLAMGCVESIGFALGLPAAQSLLTEHVAAADHGRAQGLFGTGETGAIALSAAVGGALFALAPAAPFLAAGSGALVLTVTLPFIWAPVRGTVPRPNDARSTAPARSTAGELTPDRPRAAALSDG